LTATSLIAILKSIIAVHKKINKKVFKMFRSFNEVALEEIWFIFSWRESVRGH